MSNIPTPHQLPTEHVHALAALVPRQKPPGQRISRLLYPLLDTLHPKWLRKFLFTTDPIHISHYVSSTFPSAVLTSLLQITTVDPQTVLPSPSTLHGDAYHFAGNVFYAPIFTADHTTLGFGVIDASTTLNVPWLSNISPSVRQRINFRFIRDSRTRTLVKVYDMPNQELSVVVTARIESSTNTHIFSGYFGSNELREVALREDNLLLKEHILPPLMSFQYGVHYRHCLSCGQPHSAACKCQLPVCSPAHPYDTSFFQNGMFEHVMTSEGVTSKVVCKAGRQSRRTVLGSRWSLQGVVNPMMYEALKNWSISEQLFKMNSNPLQSLLLMGSGGDRNVLNTTGNAMNNLANNMPLMQDGRGTVSGEASGVASGSHVQVELSGLDPSSSAVSIQIGGGPRTSTLATDAALDDTGQARGTVAAVPDGDISPWVPSSHSKSNLPKGEWWDKHFCDMIAEIDDKGDDFPHAVLPENVVSSDLQKFDLAAVQPEVNSGNSSGHCNDVEQHPVLRERKAELRREKNRESARRSNKRNRERREILKSELKAERAKLPLLRKKEMELRKENLTLRALFNCLPRSNKNSLM